MPDLQAWWWSLSFTVRHGSPMAPRTLVCISGAKSTVGTDIVEATYTGIELGRGALTRLAAAMPLPMSSAEFGADWETGNVVGGRWSVRG